jgi:hypothetical protein
LPAWLDGERIVLPAQRERRALISELAGCAAGALAAEAVANPAGTFSGQRSRLHFYKPLI